MTAVPAQGLLTWGREAESRPGLGIPSAAAWLGSVGWQPEHGLVGTACIAGVWEATGGLREAVWRQPEGRH